MSYKISKELFEAAMGFCKNEVSEIYVSGKNIFWHTYEDEFARNKDSKINIDSLYFKCKEWALEQGYNFRSYDNHYDVMKFDGHNFKCLAEFESSSEQQSLFDACQWIIEDKKCLKQHTIY